MKRLLKPGLPGLPTNGQVTSGEEAGSSPSRKTLRHLGSRAHGDAIAPDKANKATNR